MGPWSRSAALNAGVEFARGRYVITTDADILFSSASYRRALECLEKKPDALYLVQCRDLPEKWGCGALLDMAAKNKKLDFDSLKKLSTLRPRWGMGGFAAFSQSAFYAINGYEERMKIWGREDNDFAQRFRRAGMPLRWLSDADVEIYHMWHAPSLTKANESDEGQRAVQENTRILQKDPTIVRNLLRPFSVPKRPLVSVVIATYKRHAQLREALDSCVRQTFDNFEVIIVENGDSVGADKIVAEFDEPRFYYFRTEKTGAAAARNIGTDMAKGRYIVIHDDDDLMVSTRIEDHLAALTAGCHGSYGGWFDFDDESGEILSENPGKEFSFEALLFNGRVLIHPSTMVARGVLQAFRYDETRPAGIDYALFLRMAWAGLDLAHTGKIGIFRRMHQSNMTSLNGAIQKESADYMKKIMLNELRGEALERAREKGRRASSLICANVARANEELQSLRAGGSRIPSVITVQDLANHLSSKLFDDNELAEFLSRVRYIRDVCPKADPRLRYLLSRAKMISENRQIPVNWVRS
jgi:glycosyltransferase involved in cell wall biosynthesis